jgi:hypothetical protein
MIHGSMTRFALLALFGTAVAGCSSAQEDNEFVAYGEPVVTVVRTGQDQPRQLRVRAPRLRQGLTFDAPEQFQYFVHEDGPRLGVMVDMAKDGLTVTEVNDDSLAEAAGVMPGDIVHRIGEERIESVEDVAAALSHFSPGDAVPVAVIREGIGIVELTGTMPEPPEHEDMHLADGHRNGFLGVEIGESDDDGAGIVVAGTIPNSAAWFAGLDEGDRLLSIDGNAVDSYDALVGAISSKKPGTMVTLGYERDGATHETSVRLGHRMQENPMSMMFSPDGNMTFDMQLPGMHGQLPEGMEMYFGGEGDGEWLEQLHEGGNHWVQRLPQGAQGEWLQRVHPDLEGLHELELRIEADGKHPRILHFGNNGSMQGLHELLREFDGNHRRVEVKLNDGHGKAIIETEDGTQVFIIEDGEWIHGDDDHEHEHDDDDDAGHEHEHDDDHGHDDDDEEHEHDDGPHEG